MAYQHPDEAKWRVRVMSPDVLAHEDVAAWNALRDAHADYDSPLLSPEFARIAGEGRSDAKVALIHDEAGLAVAFAFHQRPDGLGRPIGAPFCDYSGPVVRADCSLSLAQIVALSGLGGYRTHSLLDPWNRFEAERTGGTMSLLVRLGELTGDAYIQQRRSAHPKRFKNFRRLKSLLGRDGHDVQLNAGPLLPHMRDALFGFKSDQYRASGLVDLMTAPKARALLDKVAGSPFGYQLSLWSGDQLISADFGFREGVAFHPWIAAYNPAFADYSPGNLLQKRVITEMDALGLKTYDLAEGHEHYKKYFTNTGRMLYSADIALPTARGWLLSSQSAVWNLAGASREGSAASRLRRRTDQAAICFERTSDKLADLATALRKRGVSATPPAGHAADPD